MIGTMLDLDEHRRGTIVPLVAAWLTRRGAAVVPIEVVEAEVLLAGRPGLLDVVARAGGRLAHLVVGLHAPGDGIHMLRGADDVVLGVFEDEAGAALAVDALWDAALAPLVMTAIIGEEPGTVALARDDDDAVVLDIEDRLSLSVFPWLTEGPHPGVDMLVTLDEIGFNHLAAPLALWRRQGRDLGIVQEQLTESADGWALALTSLRDLFGSSVRADQAGGDFADEARALGTMAARMHLASDKAFGRRVGQVAGWADEMEAAAKAAGAGSAWPARSVEALSALRARGGRLAMVRTHGDLHLGRTARTNQGWVIADWLPGGVDPSGAVRFRPPLADLADLAWSLGHVATAALEERDMALRPGLDASAQEWAARNRRVLVAGYLDTPGIDELVPTERALVDDLLTASELGRADVAPKVA